MRGPPLTPPLTLSPQPLLGLNLTQMDSPFPRKGRPSPAETRCSSDRQRRSAPERSVTSAPVSSRRSSSRGSGVDCASTRSPGRGLQGTRGGTVSSSGRGSEVPPDPGRSVLRPLVGRGIGPGGRARASDWDSLLGCVLRLRRGTGGMLHRSFTPPGRWPVGWMTASRTERVSGHTLGRWALAAMVGVDDARGRS